MPEDIGSIADPAERLIEATRFLVYAESRVKAGRAARNAAIRAAREAKMRRKEIARLCGVSDDTIKSVLA